jgi:hypothetical protein
MPKNGIYAPGETVKNFSGQTIESLEHIVSDCLGSDFPLPRVVQAAPRREPLEFPLEFLMRLAAYD